MKFLTKISQLLQSKREPTQTEASHITASGRVHSDHPVNRISPSQLKTILEDAERGDIQAQHELFMDIEEVDGSIAANIQTRKRAALTIDWSIVPPQEATPVEEEQTKAVSELFRQFGNLEDLIVDCMDAVGHGFSALEIHWELQQERWYPVAFKHIPQTWFKLDKDDNLRLRTPENQEGEPLAPFGWVVHRHKNRSVQQARNGLFRTLAWLYIFKHYSVRDFAEFLELYGFPIRIGKYGSGTTADEKRALLRALSDIGHNAAGIMPESMQVELHNVASGTSNGNNPFLQMIDWCEKSIARLILGQTLTSGADGKSSTNALGNVHNEVRRDLLISDVKQLEQTFNQQIILPFLLINFPNVDKQRLPRFEFDTKEPVDIQAFADALPKLVDIGVTVPHDWAINKLGIPALQEGEIALKRVQTTFNDDVPTDNTTQDKAALSARFAHGKGCPCGCQSVKLSVNQTDNEQRILDNVLDDALIESAFASQFDPMIKTALIALQRCESFEQASEALASLYPDLTSEAHNQYLTNALFLADILGASNAQR